MKKFLGWSLIIFSSVCLLLFALSLLFQLTGADFHGAPSFPQVVLSYMFTSIIFVLLFIYGLKLIKNNTITTVPYLKDLSIDLKGKITYEEYRNLMIGLTLKSPAYICILSAAVLLIASFLTSDTEASWAIVSVLFVFIILPITTLFKIKKLYSSTKILHTEVSYYISNDTLNISGEDINSTSKWSYYIRIKETKNFFLLYQSQMIAVLLHKKLFTPHELNEFKAFLQSLPLPKTLK